MVINMDLLKYGVIDSNGVITQIAVSDSQEWADANGYVLLENDKEGNPPVIGCYLSDGVYTEYVPEMPDKTWYDVRNYRDMLLAESDLLMITDRYSLYTEEQQQELLAYRQTLRDIPTAFENPEDVVFPELSF